MDTCQEKGTGISVVIFFLVLTMVKAHLDASQRAIYMYLNKDASSITLHGSHQMKFEHIDCKKDTSKILDIIAIIINEGVARLKKGKVVGVKDMHDNVRAIVIPKITTTLEILEGGVHYHYNNRYRII